MKKKSNYKQIVAIIGIVLLASLYIASLIIAIVSKEHALTALKISILATIIIPAWIYLMLMFYKLAHKKEDPEEMIFADEKDDPFTDEDFEDEQ